MTDYVTSRFLTCYDSLAREEGGWANNKNDRGGETAFGVARNFWPDWKGWAVVDATKAKIGFPKCGVKALNQALLSHPSFPGLLRDFFFDHFWVPLKGDKFACAPLASEVFEMGVNSGLRPAARILQAAINALGRPLIVDGVIGPATLAAANAIQGEKILRSFREQAEQHYRTIVRLNPSQASHLNGWLGRLEDKLWLK